MRIISVGWFVGRQAGICVCRSGERTEDGVRSVAANRKPAYAGAVKELRMA